MILERWRLRPKRIGWLLLATSVGSLLILALSANPEEDARLTSLLTRGVKTNATVTGFLNFAKQTWDITYHYEVAGKGYDGQDPAYRDERDRFPVGSTLPILYLPEDPTVSGHAVQEMARGSLVTRRCLQAYAAVAFAFGVLVLRRR